MKKNKDQFIKCDCHEHAVEIQFEDSMFFMTTWRSNNVPDKLPFWQRLALCWRLLVGKKIEPDDIILDETKARAFRDFLSNCLEDNNP